ncbi:cupin domain-containing protein [Silvibacterium acidisoli]|uniref:cupin domain-containing protein n=1 Tax=Acidobacteriaceae bacterium ZG23-2 TaxID=2883246 RepID=UPI00406BFD4A
MITVSLEMLSLRIAMDTLSSLFTQYTLSATVFFSGRLCGISSDHASDTAGHLHVLRRGTLRIERGRKKPQVVSEPAVLFSPRPQIHRFTTDKEIGAELVCATVEFGAGMLNPVVRSLPDLLVVVLRTMPALEPAVDLLFTEAFAADTGRQAAVNRLAEYVILLLLRNAGSTNLIRKGTLAGLADPRLSKAISAIHAGPALPWTLESMAEEAGMSRARFALHFNNVVGTTPFDYLAEWRIGTAQAMLKRGQALKLVAPEVGYSGTAALSRAFLKHTGETPTGWLARNSDAKV